MTSVPCYEVLGLKPSTEHTSEIIESAYLRIKEILVADINASDDIETAYDTLRSIQKRNIYHLSLTPYKESEWSWVEHEDSDGVLRSLVRRTKQFRTKEWTTSNDKKKRDIKKTKMNDRKSNRDKRRSSGGYED